MQLWHKENWHCTPHRQIKRTCIYSLSPDDFVDKNYIQFEVFYTGKDKLQAQTGQRSKHAPSYT